MDLSFGAFYHGSYVSGIPLRVRQEIAGAYEQGDQKIRRFERGEGQPYFKGKSDVNTSNS